MTLQNLRVSGGGVAALSGEQRQLPGVPWLGSQRPFVCLVSLGRDDRSSADPVHGGLEVPPYPPHLLMRTLTLRGPHWLGVGAAQRPEQGLQTSGPHPGSPRNAGLIFLIKENKKYRAIIFMTASVSVCHT